MTIILITLGVLAALAIPLSALMFYGMRDIRDLVIRDVDLSKLTDGVYAGSYHKGRWTYDVEASVHDHRLVSIVNTNTRPKALDEWNQKGASSTIDKQAIAIDVVSGATLNTKAYGKAVEVARSSPRIR